MGKISHSNYLAKSAVFKSVFDSQKRRGARPAQVELVKVQQGGVEKKNCTNSHFFCGCWYNFFFQRPLVQPRKIPAWGSSTPQHGQKRRRRKDEDFLVQKSLALWPPKFTVCSERMFFLPLFLVSFSFFFFFVARLPVGENTSLRLAGATPVPHKERWASVVLICLHCSKEGTVYPRKTMHQLRKVCHAEGVLCLSSWQQSWANPADEAFLNLVVFFHLARRSLFFVKHDKRTDKATNHNDCTNNF